MVSPRLGTRGTEGPGSLGPNVLGWEMGSRSMQLCPVHEGNNRWGRGYALELDGGKVLSRRRQWGKNLVVQSRDWWFSGGNSMCRCLKATEKL